MINEFTVINTTIKDAFGYDCDGFWDIYITIDQEDTENDHIVLSICGMDGEAEVLIPKKRKLFSLNLYGIENLIRMLNYTKESLIRKITRDKELFGNKS